MKILSHYHAQFLRTHTRTHFVLYLSLPSDFPEWLSLPESVQASACPQQGWIQTHVTDLEKISKEASTVNLNAPITSYTSEPMQVGLYLKKISIDQCYRQLPSPLFRAQWISMAKTVKF